jgi:hypothetical protein
MWREPPQIVFNVSEERLSPLKLKEGFMFDAVVIASSPEREALRKGHAVRALLRSEEGCGVAHLPAGVWGFTTAPASQEIPLFTDPVHRCTEVHKTADGEVYLLGCVKPAEARAIVDLKNLDLYPEPFEQSTQLVAVPLSRIDRRRPPTRDSGNAMHIELA